MKKTIYLAGGCFWGVQAYMKKLPGVIETETGYANGKTENPSYEEVCKNDTGHAETVRVVYNPEILPLGVLLNAFFKVVDPTQLNRQGEDVGTQYRNGVFYVEEEDQPIVAEMVEHLQKMHQETVVTEVRELGTFIRLKNIISTIWRKIRQDIVTSTCLMQKNLFVKMDWKSRN